MKTRLAILVALASTVGFSSGVYAQAVIPAPVSPTPAAGNVPVLFPSEQGAFTGLEVATQIVESGILQNGCTTAAYPLSVTTNQNGEGSAVLGGIPLNIRAVPLTVPESGRIYSVTGPTAITRLNGTLGVAGVSSQGSYSLGSEMQEVTTNFAGDSFITNELDNFRGTVIKDYWRLSALQPIPTGVGFINQSVPVNTVINYGYQQIQKHGVIAAKYWQQSQFWRQNGVRSGTYWKKVQVAPAGESCQIEVILQGSGVGTQDNINGFREAGRIIVLGPNPVGAFKQ
jgi:hypothetical protein